MTAPNGHVRGFWARLFGRKNQPPPQPPIEDRRCMNEDWRVGDLAECIIPAEQWSPWGPNHPDVGDVLRVEAVGEGIAAVIQTESGPFGGFRCYGLAFFAIPGVPYVTTGFRKLVEAEADEEFTALIKRPVRKREGA